MSELLEEWRNKNVEKTMEVVTKLDAPNKWKQLVQWINLSGLPLKFSDYQMRNMEQSPSPSLVLMDELISRSCSLALFEDMLRSSDLIDVLSLIAQPEPLKIIVQPKSEETVYVHPGGDLVLECRATGIPPPKYQWFCYNQPLIDFTEPVLTLKNFNLNDEGEYYCEVTQDTKGDIRRLVSNVAVCNIVDAMPLFLSEPPKILVKDLGMDVSLEVQVGCDSRYQLQWIKGNTLLPGENSPVLQIKKLSKSHKGIYRCLASNNAGEISSSPILLKVINNKFPSSKMALIIANSEYDNYETLTTPSNDASLLTEKLVALNFKVVTLINLTLNEMENAVDWFFNVATKDCYTLFCFIGHGFQMYNNKFMMPVDCPQISELKMENCVCDEFLVMKAKTKKVQLLVSILDMCSKGVDSSVNSDIRNEKAKEYEYEPCSRCNVIRIFSTSSYQSAYENSSHEYGIYIEHLSKYLLRDIPIIELVYLAHEEFAKKRHAEIQKPSVSCDGGHSLSLTSVATGDSMVESQMESIYKLESYHMLSFDKVGLTSPLLILPHRAKICNAIDIRFSEQLRSWTISVEVSPGGFPYDVRMPEEGAGGALLTLYNLQKATNDISIAVHLRKNVNGVLKLEDSAHIDLKIPLAATAKLWFKPPTTAE